MSDPQETPDSTKARPPGRELGASDGSGATLVDKACWRCDSKQAKVVGVRGGHWLTVACVKCGFVMSMDGE